MKLIQLVRTCSTKKRHALKVAALVMAALPAASNLVTRRASAQMAVVSDAQVHRAADYAAARRRDDLAAMQTYRPGYAFWQHVFVLPDHSIAYGSAVDGRA